MGSRLFYCALALLCGLAFCASAVSATNIKVGLVPGLPGITLPAPGLSKLSLCSHSRRGARSQSVALVRQGCEFDKEGKHFEALQKFEQASQVDPTYETALTNLVTACLVNGKLNEGLNAGTQFLNRFPASSQAREVSCMINSMNLEWRRRITAEKRTGIRVGPDTADYFAYQLVHTVRRWPAHLLPVKVYVASGKGIKQFRSSFKKDLLDSFQEWSDGCHGLICFSQVDDPEDASIECEWIDDVRKFPAHSGIEGGETIPYYNSHGLARAKIMLLTTPRSNRGKELDAAMRHVCLHEIGHSLGLMEHSDNPEDIMFYAFQGDDRTRPKLSGRDLMTLVHLYSCDLAQVNSVNGLVSSADKELSSHVSTASAPAVLPATAEKRLETNPPAEIRTDQR